MGFDGATPIPLDKLCNCISFPTAPRPSQQNHVQLPCHFTRNVFDQWDCGIDRGGLGIGDLCIILLLIPCVEATNYSNKVSVRTFKVAVTLGKMW